ncbi:MAG TPA: hypothetical protein VFH06_01745 [Candidatus Saccharimonadales bacterium]|nr:hypothetical protein [Candidatus Saccharimonadales bacterium]
MKTIIDTYIAAARPDDSQNANVLFTDRVMTSITSSEIFSSAIRKTSVTKKETLFMKLRHLPKIAIIAIAIGALLFVTGTTYAVVQTISNLSHVKVDESSTNEFGRKQLSVKFNSCDEQKKEGTTYELKRGSNLSAEDGAKVLQAKCDMDTLTSWIQNDAQSVEKMGNFARTYTRLMPGLNTADIVKEIKGNTLVLEHRGERLLAEDARVVEENKVIPRDTLKVGDAIVYFVPATFGDMGVAQESKDASGVVIFKLPLPAQYYSLEYQSYVNVRAACDGNPERTCLKSNGINHTTLVVTYGGGLPSMSDPRTPREIQGRVVSYDANLIKLDVGKGVIYTIQTPRSIIDQYNQNKVYTLAGFDNIYANTSPEDLKIKLGDSLSIGYLESANEFSSTIAWNQVSGISLMVERTPKNLDVLQKY